MESWGAAVGDGVWRKSFRECCRCGGMPSYLSQWRGRRLRGFGSITKMSFVLWNLTSRRNFHQQFLKKMQPISGWPIEKCHVLNTQLIKCRSIFWPSPIFWKIVKSWHVFNLLKDCKTLVCSILTKEVSHLLSWIDISKQPWEPWNFHLIFVLLWISTSGVCPAKYVWDKFHPVAPPTSTLASPHGQTFVGIKLLKLFGSVI